MNKCFTSEVLIVFCWFDKKGIVGFMMILKALKSKMTPFYEQKYSNYLEEQKQTKNLEFKYFIS